MNYKEAVQKLYHLNKADKVKVALSLLQQASTQSNEEGVVPEQKILWGSVLDYATLKVAGKAFPKQLTDEDVEDGTFWLE